MHMTKSSGSGPNVEHLVAELTEAAYPVALRHRGQGSWVDLELDLWKALGQAVRDWQWENSRLDC
jgi:hypothetical protein